jgi:hypothetical protein
MRAIFQAFLQLVLRRIGPEDLPDSGLLLGLAAAAYAATQAVAALQIYGPDVVVVKAVAADVVLLVLAVAVLLKAAGRPERLRRTLTALLGAGALLTVPLVPLNYWMQLFTHAGQAPAAPSIAILALLTWSLTVQGHIFSRALSTSLAPGLLVAVGYFVLNYALILQLAPVRR